MLGSAISFARFAVAGALVILLTPWFASEGYGGLAAPTAALSLWLILAKHQFISEPWRIKDEQLAAWLESELPAPGSDHKHL